MMDSPTAQKKPAGRSEPLLQLANAGELIENYPDPAFVADADGTVSLFNKAAQTIVQALEAGQIEGLKSLIRKCAHEKQPCSDNVAQPGNDGFRRYRFSLLPCASDGCDLVVVLGYETTFENNLTAALIDSRQRFRDLVECSSDLSWETDYSGKLTFVSGGEILGYAAAELNGLLAVKLLHPDYPPPVNVPFETNNAVEDAEVWLRAKDGEAVCVLISAVAINDDSGDWSGARGVCRDVTEERRLDAALANARTRQQLLGHIVSSIRDVVDPSKMLTIAAEETALATHASHSRIWRIENGEFAQAATHSLGAEAPDEVFAEVRNFLFGPDGQMAPEGGIREIATGEYDCLVGWSQHHNVVNGAIAIARSSDELPWNADEEDVLKGVSAQLGIAMEQIAKQRELEHLLKTDQLTGLHNRRSFEKEVGARLAEQALTKLPCAVFYVDLDNFKSVNDVYGHAKGDELLRVFGEKLLALITSKDLAARIGGDEFALWIDDTSEENAGQRAEGFLHLCTDLQAMVPKIRPMVNMSIGIAISRSDEPEDFKRLLEQADEAMYEAKKRGKAGYGFAERRRGHDKDV